MKCCKHDTYIEALKETIQEDIEILKYEKVELLLAEIIADIGGKLENRDLTNVIAKGIDQVIKDISLLSERIMSRFNAFLRLYLYHLLENILDIDSKLQSTSSNKIALTRQKEYYQAPPFFECVKFFYRSSKCQPLALNVQPPTKDTENINLMRKTFFHFVTVVYEYFRHINRTFDSSNLYTNVKVNPFAFKKIVSFFHQFLMKLSSIKFHLFEYDEYFVGVDYSVLRLTIPVIEYLQRPELSTEFGHPAMEYSEKLGCSEKDCLGCTSFLLDYIMHCMIDLKNLNEFSLREANESGEQQPTQDVAISNPDLGNNSATGGNRRSVEESLHKTPSSTDNVTSSFQRMSLDNMSSEISKKLADEYFISTRNIDNIILNTFKIAMSVAKERKAAKGNN